MFDLWSVGSQNKRIKLRGTNCLKTPSIGIFHPISGQSINPDEKEHSSLLQNVSQALIEKEERINGYQKRAFDFKLSKNTLENESIDLPEDSLNHHELDEMPKKPRALTKKQKRRAHQKRADQILEKGKVNPKRLADENAIIEECKPGFKKNISRKSQKNPGHDEKIIIPEVSECPPIRPCAILPSNIHPLDMVHKRMRCRGLISNKKPIFNKRFHRSIRFKWSWVPYYRNHITTFRKDLK